MSKKFCCVTGHRKLPDAQAAEIRRALQKEIEAAVADGYFCFFTGFAEGVDQYFAQIVLEMKKSDPRLCLYAAIPYLARHTALQKNAHTKAMLDACTGITVIQDVYFPNVYAKRNRYMVEHSSRVIAVYDGRGKGGTANTIRLARQLGKDLREIPIPSAS